MTNCRAVFLMKAPQLLRSYVDLFAAVAVRAEAFVVAGSVFLPDLELSDKGMRALAVPFGGYNCRPRVVDTLNNME